MKVLLAIPSYKRPYILEKRTWSWACKLQKCDVKIFCDSKEYIYYSQVAGKENVVKGARQGDSDGLIQQLNFIGQYAIDNGYDIVWKVDDDMLMKKDKHKKESIPSAVDVMISNIIDLFRSGADVVQVSKPIEYRYSDKEGYKKRRVPFAGTYFTKPSLMKYDTRVFALDEIQLYLHCIDQKQSSFYTCHDMYFDSPIGKYEGGLQMFDRKHLMSYTYLKEKYPEIDWKESDKSQIDIGNNIDYSAYKKKLDIFDK